jgi:hypothetical protein
LPGGGEDILTRIFGNGGGSADSATTTHRDNLSLAVAGATPQLQISGALPQPPLFCVEKQSNAQVRRAYQLAFGREAADEELAAATSLVDQHGLRAFCRAILNSSELIYVD